MEISLNKRSQTLIQKYSALGKDSANAIAAIVEKTMLEAANLAADAYRSKVPVKTQELRGSITASLDTSAAFGGRVPWLLVGTVTIPDAVHRASYDRKKPTDAKLARLLDQLGLKRSRTSIPAGSYSASGSDLTKDWISEATVAAKAAIKGLYP